MSASSTSRTCKARIGEFDFLTLIVLYKTPLAESGTLRTLAGCRPGRKNPLTLAVWDNSPHSQKPTLSDRFQLLCWHHDPSNSGLVKAYNAAAVTARDAGYEWLLLLDQDSHLPADFLEQAEAATRNATDDAVALVPTVVSDGIHRSPVRAILDFPVNFRHAKDLGVSPTPIYAINSGMLVRTAFLEEIGGYSNRFWLDAVDHWFCREVYRRGKRIAIFDTQIEHSISVNEPDKPLSISRYQSILESQSTFVMSSGRWRTKLFYAGLLAAHGFRQLIQRRDKTYVRTAFEQWTRFVLAALKSGRS